MGSEIEIKIADNREPYMDLLLLGDEEISQVVKYMDLGTLYVMESFDVIGICLVIDVGEGILEIKNLAIKQEFQKMGYGRKMIDFIINEYRGKYQILQVGTGDSPATLPFYEKCGFNYSHVVENFFLDNYPNPIVECGIQLKDMIYLRLDLTM